MPRDLFRTHAETSWIAARAPGCYGASTHRETRYSRRGIARSTMHPTVSLAAARRVSRFPGVRTCRPRDFCRFRTSTSAPRSAGCRPPAAERRRDQRRARARCRLAIERDAHAILVPGDLFDHEGVDADTLAFAVHAFDVAGCPPVFIAPAITTPRPSTSPDWSPRLLAARGWAWPAHVHVFDVAARGRGTRLPGRARCGAAVSPPTWPSPERPLAPDDAEPTAGPLEPGVLDVAVFHGSREGQLPAGAEDDGAVLRRRGAGVAVRLPRGRPLPPRLPLTAADGAAAGVRLAYAGSAVALDAARGRRARRARGADRVRRRRAASSRSSRSSSTTAPRPRPVAVDVTGCASADRSTAAVAEGARRRRRHRRATSSPCACTGRLVARRALRRARARSCRARVLAAPRRARGAPGLRPRGLPRARPATTEERFARALLGQLDAEQDPAARACSRARSTTGSTPSACARSCRPTRSWTREAAAPQGRRLRRAARRVRVRSRAPDAGGRRQRARQVDAARRDRAPRSTGSTTTAAPTGCSRRSSAGARGTAAATASSSSSSATASATSSARLRARHRRGVERARPGGHRRVPRGQGRVPGRPQAARPRRRGVREVRAGAAGRARRGGARRRACRRDSTLHARLENAADTRVGDTNATEALQVLERAAPLQLPRGRVHRHRRSRDPATRAQARHARHRAQDARARSLRHRQAARAAGEALRRGGPRAPSSTRSRPTAARHAPGSSRSSSGATTRAGRSSRRWSASARTSRARRSWPRPTRPSSARCASSRASPRSGVPSSCTAGTRCWRRIGPLRHGSRSSAASMPTRKRMPTRWRY